MSCSHLQIAKADSPLQESPGPLVLRSTKTNNFKLLGFYFSDLFGSFRIFSDLFGSFRIFSATPRRFQEFGGLQPRQKPLYHPSCHLLSEKPSTTAPWWISVAVFQHRISGLQSRRRRTSGNPKAFNGR